MTGHSTKKVALATGASGGIGLATARVSDMPDTRFTVPAEGSRRASTA